MANVMTIEPTQAVIYIAGVDEAGRGPLAGDVFAAAVVLSSSNPIDGLDDSKKLSEKKRDYLAPIIKSRAVAWAIATASVAEIDEINILQATLLAMKRAVEQLGLPLTEVLIDGNRAPKLAFPTRTIIGGDASVAEISAASILAKTARDASLVVLHAKYPGYGFDHHKGYGTALHMAKLKELGPCPAHRRSFAPVRALCNANRI
jgi:ribonuclease HII